MWFITVSWRKAQVVLCMAGLILLMAGTAGISARQEVAVLSYSLAGRTIVIDPGHGGSDPGAVGRVTGALEKDITLAISKRLALLISQAGGMPVLTRESDQELSDEGFQGSLLEKKRQDLARRVERAKQVNAEVFLSIHVNADPSPRWHGAQTFYYASSPQSQALAISIQDEMVRILGNNNRKAKEAAFYVMEKTDMPAVIVEVGFISNPAEERLLIDEMYQSKVAYAIFSGLAKYYAEGGDQP